MFHDLKVVILESHNTTNKNNTLMAWVAIVLVDIIDNRNQCFETPVDTFSKQPDLIPQLKHVIHRTW